MVLGVNVPGISAQTKRRPTELIGGNKVFCWVVPHIDVVLGWPIAHDPVESLWHGLRGGKLLRDINRQMRQTQYFKFQSLADRAPIRQDGQHFRGGLDPSKNLASPAVELYVGSVQSIDP